VVRAHDDHGAAVGEVDAELLAAGDEVAAVGHVAAQHGFEEGALGGLGGALGRAQALDLGGDQRGDDAQERLRRLLAGAGPQAQAADRLVADAQLVRLDARGRRPSASARRRSTARRPRARRSSDR
jgi:hypothetical protein